MPWRYGAMPWRYREPLRPTSTPAGVALSKAVRCLGGALQGRLGQHDHGVALSKAVRCLGGWKVHGPRQADKLSRTLEGGAMPWRWAAARCSKTTLSALSKAVRCLGGHTCSIAQTSSASWHSGRQCDALAVNRGCSLSHGCGYVALSKAVRCLGGQARPGDEEEKTRVALSKAVRCLGGELEAQRAEAASLRRTLEGGAMPWRSVLEIVKDQEPLRAVLRAVDQIVIEAIVPA